MDEVSCRATAVLLETLQMQGVEAERLAAAARLPLDHLQSGRRRIDWETFVRLLDEAERCVGLEGLEAAGSGLNQVGWNRILAALGRVAWTEYQFLGALERYALPTIYRVLHFERSRLPDGRIRLELGIPESHRGSLPLMYTFLGMARTLPKLLGGKEEARVEAELGAHRTVLLIQPPPRGRIGGWLARRLQGSLLGNRIFEALFEQFRESEFDYVELERSRAALAARSRSLATLNAVADTLYGSLDFTDMARRAADTVAEHTGFPRVGLFMLDDSGAKLELAALTGSPEVRSEQWGLPLGVGMVEEVLRSGRPLFVADIAGARFAQPHIQQLLLADGLKSFILVPLLHASHVVGVLGLASPDRALLAEFDEGTFLALGKTVAAALTSAGYVARIEREVRERKQAEQALREGEERLRQLAENIDGVFYLWDAESGRTLYLSPSYLRTTGCELPEAGADLLRNGLLELVHPEDRPKLPAVFDREVPRERYQLEYRIVQRGGALRSLVDRAYPVYRADGSVARVAGLAQDVTEVRELETQLRHSQKMDAVGLLAGGVAHDFNNLLTVISGYAELLLDGFEGSDARASTAVEILRASERASALTRKLLALSRKQILDPAVYDLNQIVRELRALLKSLIGEEVELRLDLAPERLPVRVDRGQVEQMLINLAANARDAMEGGGELRVRSSTVELGGEGLEPELAGAAGVRLSVEDTGRGMDDEIRARVFEPFFTTKGHDEGTGLGLATVYGIVRQSGGRIRVHSKLGEGSCFEVDLPREGVEELSEAGAPTEAVEETTSGDATVLLVEDQARVRKLASRVLRERGYRVVEAADGLEALEQLDKQGADFDLVVTDLVMPNMGGVELAEKVRAELPSIPILFVSGHADDGGEEPPELMEGSKLLMKPFRPATLTRAVQESLASTP